MNWTFDDLSRLTAEAFASGDAKMLGRILASDNFEPSLSLKPVGLATLFVRTKRERQEWRERVTRIFAERDAIKARWNTQDAQNP